MCHVNKGILVSDSIGIFTSFQWDEKIKTTLIKNEAYPHFGLYCSFLTDSYDC